MDYGNAGLPTPPRLSNKPREEHKNCPRDTDISSCLGLTQIAFLGCDLFWIFAVALTPYLEAPPCRPTWVTPGCWFLE